MLSGASKPPNFVILLTDDQRFDTIRALGNREVSTPDMDRLAARGVTFTQACTQGGLTGAICMPSRAQIMTGRNVFQVHRGIVDRQNAPDPALVTFPEHLRKNGYTTFHTGKWHNGPALFQRSFSSGSNIFLGGMSDQLKVLVHDYDPSGEYAKEHARTGEKFSSELFADAAIGFLREHDKSRPFVLDVAFTSPHDPRMAPKPFSEMYSPGQVSLPRNFLPQHPFDNGELKVRDELLAPFPRTEAEIRRHIAAYYAMVSEVDAQIGRVLDALEQSREAGSTYVIFAGDNGLAVGQHGLLGKQNLYDHSLRVPLVITGPGIRKGEHNASLCHLMDIAPTVCDLAGYPLASVTDGLSLAQAAKSGKMLERDAVISAYRDAQRALRTREWKLIVYSVGGVETAQLFNLKDDPLEMRNLAAAPEHAGRVREMRRDLAQRLQKAGDTAAWVAG